MKVAASAKEWAQEQDCVPIELPPVATGYWRTLDFLREQQCQANWCWAAVASSIAHFYRPSTIVTQCRIANGELRRKDCCDAKCNTGGPCDVYGFLMSSLFRVGHFRKLVLSKQATLEQVRGEIDKLRPLCARLAWFRGGAHFVTK